VGLSLVSTIANPIEVHIDGFQMLLFDNVIVMPHAVLLSICMGLLGWLWVAQLGQCNAKWTNADVVGGH